MKKNGVLVFIIVILLVVMAFMVGWYLGTKQENHDKSEDINLQENQTKNDTLNTETKKENEDLSGYPEWIQYLLNSDIQSITYYKWMDSSDSNYKADKNSLYKVEISKEQLKEIFNELKKGEMKVVAGKGGTADYLRISYVSNNKTYDIDFRQSFIDYINEDSKLVELLKKENTEIINSLTDDAKEIFGVDPIPNAVNWDYTVLDNYFDSKTAQVYYY